MTQKDIDTKNAAFWNELCGSALARSLGIIEVSPETLRQFDKAYMAMYPYLKKYFFSENVKGQKVLEIGLGFGTLGQMLVSWGCDYFGLDIAEGPVAMMRYRLAQLGKDGEEQVKVGSALEIPYSDESFSYVYSIGCLHHTGNLMKAVSEVYRILVPNGKAIVSLYHSHSFRQIVKVNLIRLRKHLSRLFLVNKQTDVSERVRGLYDTNQLGVAAPYTGYVSRTEAKQLFKDFTHVKIDIQNFHKLAFKGRTIIPRKKLLNNIGRVAGLDLYITAKK